MASVKRRLRVGETPIGIRRVIFNNPATIVFWEDGTKSVVKTSPNDKFDKEKAILWAFCLKKSSGTKTKTQKEVAKLVGDKNES